MLDADKALAFGLIGSLGGVLLFFSAFSRLRLWRLMSNTPTSKARSAAMGFDELSGVAQPDDDGLQIAPVSGVSCLWWRYTVEEERTRIDSKGRTEHYWADIADERSFATFKLRDASGDLRVDPKGAEVESPYRLQATSGSFFGGAMPTGPAVARYRGFWSGRLRYTEWRIQVGGPLYALGTLKPRPQGATIGQDSDRPYLLATMSEDEAKSSIFGGMALRLIGGVLAFGGGLFLLLSKGDL